MAVVEAPAGLGRLRAWRGLWVGLLLGVLSVAGARALIRHVALPPFLVAPLVLPDTPGVSDAIVVLGAGVSPACAPDDRSVRRTMLAVRLFKEGRGPVLLFTGGTGFGGPCAVGDAMAAFARDLGAPSAAVLVERTSRTTWENAVESSPILKGRGIHRILVVTDGFHARRAEACFRRLGFEVARASVPPPEAYRDNLDVLAQALHEYVGLWYYRLEGRI